MRKKILLAFSTFAFLFISLCLPIYATSEGDENISIEYQIEESKNNSAKIQVNVKNTSNTSLYDVDIENDLPNEFEYIGEKSMHIDVLKPQEEKKFETEIELKKYLLMRKK